MQYVLRCKEDLIPTLDQFLTSVNGTKRVRLLDKGDYSIFVVACQEARLRAADREPYYWEASAGGVANSYGYAATTGRCGVYTTPDGEVVARFDRAKVHGRSVPCIFPNGERAYRKWFKQHRDFWFPEGDDE